jgi:hypothetical protein
VNQNNPSRYVTEYLDLRLIKTNKNPMKKPTKKAIWFSRHHPSREQIEEMAESLEKEKYI